MLGPEIDPIQVANHRLALAGRDAEIGKHKASTTSALLSIAASLRQLCDQNDAGLAGQQKQHALSAEIVELTKQMPQPIPGELISAPGCCQGTPTPSDRVMNMLEFAFGIIANVEENAGTHKTPQWRNARDEFIADYNRLLNDIYTPNTAALSAQARAEVAKRRQQLVDRRDES